MGENKPDTRWKNVEAELTSIYINKTTGGYVCPELALAGEWKQLQSFLVSWAKSRTKKRGEPAEDINVLKSIDFESNELVAPYPDGPRERMSASSLNNPLLPPAGATSGERTHGNTSRTN